MIYFGNRDRRRPTAAYSRGWSTHVGSIPVRLVRFSGSTTAARLRGAIWKPRTPHGMRAGFVTTAYSNGVSDEEIMGHTHHRSLTTMRGYVRRAKLATVSPAGKLGL